MRKSNERRSKSAVRYFAFLIAILLFFFFTNDFGLIDIQKTAIVISVGVDREEDEFVLTTQVAVPQASKQGEQVEPVQIESRGKTVAQAFGEVNAKTGWYPKLVFCDLLVFGKEAAEKNLFEALDFFLRNDYVSDGCLLVTTEEQAKDVVNSTTPIEKISGLAVQKVLSDHSARVGSVLPTTLRTFASGYFGAGQSGYMPVLKKEKPVGEGGEQSESSGGGQSESGGQSGSSGGQSATKGAGEQSVFTANETALFKQGVMVGKLDQTQTFALAAVKEKLRLASYSVESAGSNYTLVVKKNESKIKFSVDKNAQAKLKIEVKITAGVEDISTPHTVTELGSVGKIPKAVYDEAGKQLKKEIETVFQAGKECGCDLFGVTEKLKRQERKYFSAYKDDLLDRLALEIEAKFVPLR